MLVFFACGGQPEGESATTSTEITSPVTTDAAANALDGFGRRDVVIAGEPWMVAVADTPVLRSQGTIVIQRASGANLRPAARALRKY